MQFRLVESLTHDGNLYLSAQDAITLAWKTNLDIEVQRYGPHWRKRFAARQCGGALRSVGVRAWSRAPPVSVCRASMSTNIGGVGAAGQGVS